MSYQPNQWGQQGPPLNYQQPNYSQQLPPQGFPQQQYPGQPQFVPPVQQQPPKKKKPNVGCIIGITIIVLLAIIAVAGKPDSTASTVQPTPGKATEVPKPTTAPLTPKERILAKARENNGTDNNYLASLKTFQTTIVLGAQWSDGTMKDSVKIECFDMQKALWTTSPPLDLKTVVVTIKGDVVDQYGKESKEQVGWCSLASETAAKFQWQSLTWRTAWGVYDNQGLAPFLQKA